MKILFICTHNRCRSILAEAITNHIGQSSIQAASAGSTPEGEVHSLSLHYLLEYGISTKGLQSESWDDYESFNPDAVITLCDNAANETCPQWFGDSVQVHWGLADPSRSSSGSNDKFDQEAAFKNTIRILEQRAQQLLVVLNRHHLMNPSTEDAESVRDILNTISADIY